MTKRSLKYFDESYLLSVVSLINEKRYNIVGKNEAVTLADIFLLSPTGSPQFPLSCNPLWEELSGISDRHNDYRVLALIQRNPHDELQRLDVFLEALQDLKFEIRRNNSYKNLDRFRSYLSAVSDHLDGLYSPYTEAGKVLARMGFNVTMDISE